MHYNNSMPQPQIHITAATPGDADAIAELLRPYAERQIVLPRTAEDIRQFIANFLIAKQDDGQLLGSVALRDFGDGLQEIRSLAVRPDACGNGLGSRLVNEAVAFARRRQATTVFALTLRPTLFHRLGFDIVPRDNFPRKVWLDCRKCPKFTACDEIAVAYTL